MESQRLDKWLWYARIAKTRTLAANLVQAGRVRVNSEKTAKTSFALKVGDVVTISLRGVVRVLKVAAPGSRRGPAREAQLLYEDLSPGRHPASSVSDGHGADSGTVDSYELSTPVAAPRAPGTGRPTKRDRRSTDQFRRMSADPSTPDDE